MDLQTGHLEDRDHAQFFLIIIYYEAFTYFFPNALMVSFQQGTIAL